MSRFIYEGPVSSVTLRLADGTEAEVALHPGRAVDLPADHDYVRTLVARGFLRSAGVSPAIPGSVGVSPAIPGRDARAPKKTDGGEL